MKREDLKICLLAGVIVLMAIQLYFLWSIDSRLVLLRYIDGSSDQCGSNRGNACYVVPIERRQHSSGGDFFWGRRD